VAKHVDVADNLLPHYLRRSETMQTPHTSSADLNYIDNNDAGEIGWRADNATDIAQLTIPTA